MSIFYYRFNRFGIWSESEELLSKLNKLFVGVDCN